MFSGREMSEGRVVSCSFTCACEDVTEVPSAMFVVAGADFRRFDIGTIPTLKNISR